MITEKEIKAEGFRYNSEYENWHHASRALLYSHTEQTYSLCSSYFDLSDFFGLEKIKDIDIYNSDSGFAWGPDIEIGSVKELRAGLKRFKQWKLAVAKRFCKKLGVPLITVWQVGNSNRFQKATTSGGK